MKITTAKHFFAACVKLQPGGWLDLITLPTPHKDLLLLAYLRDLGGNAHDQVRDGLAMARGNEARQAVLNSAYRNCELEMIELCTQYNDWCDLQHAGRDDANTIDRGEVFFNRRRESDESYYGHKPSDF